MYSAVRILRQTLVNPQYDKRIKRGIRSIVSIDAGMPFYVKQSNTNPNFYSTSTSIDIPLLGLKGITDETLVQQLITASTEYTLPKQYPNQTIPKLPDDESLIGCGNCRQSIWRASLSKSDYSPRKLICVNCGNTVLMIVSQHAPGTA